MLSTARSYTGEPGVVRYARTVPLVLSWATRPRETPPTRENSPPTKTLAPLVLTTYTTPSAEGNPDTRAPLLALAAARYVTGVEPTVVKPPPKTTLPSA